jgi:hypothetical protein
VAAAEGIIVVVDEIIIIVAAVAETEITVAVAEETTGILKSATNFFYKTETRCKAPVFFCH